MEAGNGRFAIHADAFARKTSDLHITGFARGAPASLRTTSRMAACPISAPSGWRRAGRLLYLGRDCYVGADYSAYRNEYGTPAEDDVRLRMKQYRFALEGEARN